MSTDIKPATIQNRIAAMHEKVRVQREKEEAQERAYEEALEKVEALYRSVTGDLQGLEGLPIRAGDGESRECEITSRKPAWPFSLLLMIGTRAAWVTFSFHFDPDRIEEPPWIEHDGDRITPDVAVDMAVAWVESHLVVEPRPEDDDIPF